MALNRNEKEKKLAEIKDLLGKAKAFVLVDYKGITVEQDTALRKAFRANGCTYSVYKNRLIKIALNEMGFTDYDKFLEGPSAIAVSDSDIIAPAKVVADKIAEFKNMSIKCGMVEGEFYDANQVNALAKLPSKEILVAQLLGMLLAPISGFARAIDAIAKKKEA